MKVSELTGAHLDYWVAKARGHEAHIEFGEVEVTARDGSQWIASRFAPSANWQEGGPIIERERIAVFSFDNGKEWGADMRQHDEHWIDTGIYDCDARGATPLIAAMRAYVAGKFGEEVPDQ